MILRTRPVLAIAATAIALTVGLSGCANKGDAGGGDSGSTAAASNLDAKSLLADASSASKSVTSVHFVVNAEGKVPNLPLSKAEGDLNVKPATQAKGTADLNMGGNLKGDFVFIDDHMYADISGKYVDYGDGAAIFPVGLLFDPAKGIPHVLESVTDPVASGTESIDGADTTKVSGKVRSEDVSALTGTRVVNPATKDVPVPVTFWIQSGGDHQLVRLQLAPAKDASLTMTFSKWGDKATVVKPDVPAPAPVSSAAPGAPKK